MIYIEEQRIAIMKSISKSLGWQFKTVPALLSLLWMTYSYVGQWISLTNLEHNCEIIQSLCNIEYIYIFSLNLFNVQRAWEHQRTGWETCQECQKMPQPFGEGKRVPETREIRRMWVILCRNGMQLPEYQQQILDTIYHIHRRSTDNSDSFRS